MKSNRTKITGTSDRARARLGLAPAGEATPNTKRQPIPVVHDEGPSPVARLAMIRVMLRGAARDYEAESDFEGREGMRLDSAALAYARELIAQECEAHGWQMPVDVLAILDRHIEKLSR